jgi:hypothetical protein
MKYKKHFLTIFALILFIFSCNFAVAADINNNTPASSATPSATPTASKPIPFLTNPIKVNNVQSAIYLFVDLAIFVGSILAVLAFIVVGFKFVMAQGNDSKLSEAKQWFLYAVIGTAILIGSKVIVEVIKSTLISTGVVNESLLK